MEKIRNRLVAYQTRTTLLATGFPLVLFHVQLQQFLMYSCAGVVFCPS